MKTYSKNFPGVFLLATFAMLFLNFGSFAQTYEKYYQDGQLYVKFKDSYNPQIAVQADKSVKMQDATYFRDIMDKYEVVGITRPIDINDPKLLRTFQISFKDHFKLEQAIADLQQKPEIEYAEKVPMHYCDYTPDDSLYNLVNGPSNWNWHLDVINAEAAWDITQGSPDIKVAIVDNAIWSSHPDLADKIVLQRDTYYNINNSSPPNSGSASDWSHGTHCAGLATAITNNGIGVAGIGFNTSIIAVKSSNNNQANGIYMVAGVTWAMNNGADIISMSFGGSGSSTTEQNLMNTAHNMGIVLVAAAGNDNVTTPHYPSNYNHVISVASTDGNDHKSDFSNYNTSVDVSAPGGVGLPGPGGLLSTFFANGSMGYYDYISGTSMACPMVSGLASLVLSINPNLSPDVVEQILESGCDDIYSVNPDYIGMLGAGRINAFNSVKLVPFQPVAEFSTPVTIITPGTAISFTDLSVGIPSSWTWNFTGGTPSSSTEQNPTITYNTAGVYPVSLTVQNAYGDNLMTKTDYITVSANPVPYVQFSVSDTSTCIFTPVAFTDLSLYNPTSWNWDFNPQSYMFVNGTTQSSQNPEVQFLAPGSYNVILSATNANGTFEKTFENFMIADGMSLPFEEDFENATSSTFELSANSKAIIKVDKRSAFEGNYGLHFTGSGSLSGWVGSPTATTPEQAWDQNVDFQASASVCNVDATQVDGIYLFVTMRQTFSLGNKLSWFRVLANGNQIPDVEGNLNFNPVTNADPFVTRQFNLADYANSAFTLTLQSSCRLVDYFYAQGDNVFIDNIGIYGSLVGVDEWVELPFEIVNAYPNPANDVLNINYLSNKAGQIEISLTNSTGQKVFNQDYQVSEGNFLQTLNTSNFGTGVYFLTVRSNTATTTKKIVIN